MNVLERANARATKELQAAIERRKEREPGFSQEELAEELHYDSQGTISKKIKDPFGLYKGGGLILPAMAESWYRSTGVNLPLILADEINKASLPDAGLNELPLSLPPVIFGNDKKFLEERHRKVGSVPLLSEQLAEDEWNDDYWDYFFNKEAYGDKTGLKMSFPMTRLAGELLPHPSSGHDKLLAARAYEHHMSLCKEYGIDEKFLSDWLLFLPNKKPYPRTVFELDPHIYFAWIDNYIKTQLQISYEKARNNYGDGLIKPPRNVTLADILRGLHIIQRDAEDQCLEGNESCKKDLKENWAYIGTVSCYPIDPYDFVLARVMRNPFNDEAAMCWCVPGYSFIRNLLVSPVTSGYARRLLCSLLSFRLIPCEDKHRYTYIEQGSMKPETKVFEEALMECYVKLTPKALDLLAWEEEVRNLGFACYIGNAY